MAGFIVAIISGALMSLQGVLNTNVTKASSRADYHNHKLSSRSY